MPQKPQGQESAPGTSPEGAFEQEPLGGEQKGEQKGEHSRFDFFRRLIREQWNNVDISERNGYFDELISAWNYPHTGDGDYEKLEIPRSLEHDEIEFFFNGLFLNFVSADFAACPPARKTSIINELIRLHYLLSTYHLRNHNAQPEAARESVMSALAGQTHLPKLVGDMRKSWDELSARERGLLLDQIAKIRAKTRDPEDEREHEDTRMRRIMILEDPLSDFQTCIDAIRSPEREKLTPAERMNDIDEMIDFHHYFQTRHLKTKI